MLLDHLEGILNYCRIKVRMGVVEAMNGNIKALLRRGRGYKNLRYLLLKAQRMAAVRLENDNLAKAARIPAQSRLFNELAVFSEEKKNYTRRLAALEGCFR